jgi:hypothetical protein
MIECIEDAVRWLPPGPIFYAYVADLPADHVLRIRVLGSEPVFEVLGDIGDGAIAALARLLIGLVK